MPQVVINVKRKIFFFDIDGTLLDQEKQIPSKTRDAIRLLKKAGHQVLIATGRAPFMFKEIRDELGISSFVSINGQYVVIDNTPVYTNPLDKRALEELIETAASLNHPIIYMDEYEMKMTVPGHDYIDESMGSLKLTATAAHDPEFFKGKDIYQALLFCTENEENLYEEKYKQFNFTRWHQLSVDVDPAGGTKAKGIEKVLQLYNMSLDDAYAFGDGLNDIEMLKLIPNSFAMGNGEEEVKQAARFITKRVEEDGIWHGLKMAGII